MRRAWRRGIRGLRHSRHLLARWDRLSFRERLDLVELVLLIPTVTVALRTFGFRRTHQWIDRRGAQASSDRHPGARFTPMTTLRRARRYAPYTGNCLSQSLALLWLLKGRGVPASLCLGARLENGQLAAHAWVEHDGRVLNDTVDVRERFSAFEAFSPARVTWS